MEGLCNQSIRKSRIKIVKNMAAIHFLPFYPHLVSYLLFGGGHSILCNAPCAIKNTQPFFKATGYNFHPVIHLLQFVTWWPPISYFSMSPEGIPCPSLYFNIIFYHKPKFEVNSHKYIIFWTSLSTFHITLFCNFCLCFFFFFFFRCHSVYSFYSWFMLVFFFNLLPYLSSHFSPVLSCLILTLS